MSYELSEKFKKQIEKAKENSSQPFFWETYKYTLKNAKMHFYFIKNGKYKKINNSIYKDLEKNFLFLQDYEEFVKKIYQFKEHDYLFAMHSTNVAMISALIGKILNINQKEINTLLKMGFLHDIGKMAIKEKILYKKGLLTNKEKHMIRKHTILGTEMLKKINEKEKEVWESVILHHEKLDGNGYPFKHSKEKIPFLVQIVTIADLFDTICSSRTYKKNNSIFYAFEELLKESKENKVNYEISYPFIQTFMNFFVNKKVLLNNNEIVTIHKINFNYPTKPLVKDYNDNYIELSKKDNLFILKEV